MVYALQRNKGPRLEKLTCLRLVHIASLWSLACLATNIPLRHSLSVQTLRALIDSSVDMTRFEVQRKDVSKIRLRSGDFIDKIEIHYRDSTSIAHGDDGDEPQESFVLLEGEKLIKIETEEQKDALIRCRFFTDSGRYSQWYGRKSTAAHVFGCGRLINKTKTFRASAQSPIFDIERKSDAFCITNIVTARDKMIRTPEYKTWSLLIEGIKHENVVFKFFWNKGNLAPESFESDSTTHFLTHLEDVYRSLLEGKMKYQMGDFGAHFDLFLLCVLMNERELAFEFWKQCEVPVGVAICAAALFRAMAKKYFNTDPVVCDIMRENADWFEQLAIGVQTAAKKDDSENQLALKALDIHLLYKQNRKLFEHDTILDLVVEYHCTTFLSKHCRAAIQIQLYGDMNAKKMNTVDGMLRILLGIGTLGLVPAFIPQLWAWGDKIFGIHWEPPPESERMRRSRQRRVKPGGSDGPSSSASWLPPALSSVLEMQGMRLVCLLPFLLLLLLFPSLLLLLLLPLLLLAIKWIWLDDFSWYERLYLFWTCPVVLFHTDKIICVCINLMFTAWFVAHRQAVGSGEHSIPIPFKVSSNLDNCTAAATISNATISKTCTKTQAEPLQGVEIALCIYYGCSLLREVTEIMCEMAVKWENKMDVLKEYISCFWNVLDVGEIIAFVAGILYRVTAIPHRVADAQEYDHKDEEWTNWSLAYGVCLFLAWFRVLRSFTLSKLGMLVGMFHTMLIDVSIFIVIYFVCLVACTMLFIGIASPDILKPTCMEGDLEPPEGHPDAAKMNIQCRSTYILLRTLFQSFGDFYLDEMANTPAVFYLIFTFILLNVVLLNLLIAMMSSTYERERETNEQKALLDAYDIARKSAYICISAPCPFNIVATVLEICIFVIFKKEVDKKFKNCRFGRKLELFLRRNSQPWTWYPPDRLIVELQDIESPEDRAIYPPDRLIVELQDIESPEDRAISVCMELAKKKAVEQGYGEMDHDTSLEFRIDKLNHTIAAKFKSLDAKLKAQEQAQIVAQEQLKAQEQLRKQEAQEQLKAQEQLRQEEVHRQSTEIDNLTKLVEKQTAKLTEMVEVLMKAKSLIIEDGPIIPGKTKLSVPALQRHCAELDKNAQMCTDVRSLKCL